MGVDSNTGGPLSPDEAEAGTAATAKEAQHAPSHGGAAMGPAKEKEVPLAVYELQRRPCFDASRTVFNGATVFQWGRIAYTFIGDVEWSKYGHRFLFLCLTSICMSIIALVEYPICWFALRRQKINERPVFILGHPRSGTTLLHNMISYDTDRFSYCNTMHCLFPSVFLLLNKIRCVFESAMPATRPMDNMPMGFEVPQEDELGNMVLTGGLSPFLLFFYQKRKHQKRLLDCLDFYRGPDGKRPVLPAAAPKKPEKAAAAQHAAAAVAPGDAKAEEDVEAGGSGGGAGSAAAAAEAGPATAVLGDVELSPLAAEKTGASAAAPAAAAAAGGVKAAAAVEEEMPLNQYYQRWSSCWMHFLKKVSYAVGAERRLLLKSPAHTARVRVLLKLFPNAQFIFVHRNPYEVFQSMAKMTGAICGLSNFYDSSDAETTEFILEQYKVMFEAYNADRELIPAGNLVELRYDELEQDIIGTLSSTYRRLGWDAPPMEAWEAYVAAHHGDNYTKNKHSSLSPELRRRIAKEWAAAFDEFGYDV